MSLITKKRKRRCIPSEWDELPETVIEQIYVNLDRSDWLNMSLVCKSWSQEYGSPSLWKTFSFNFKKSNLDFDVWPEVKFTQKFGSMFRDVAITIPNGITRKAFKKGIQQMQLFFEALLTSKNQLLSIKFTNFNSSVRLWHKKEYATLFQSISKFMRSQNNLQTVEFCYCDYKDDDGVNLLILICENNSHTLKTLILKQFVRNRFENGEDGNNLILQYRTLLKSFMNLEFLKIDYSQFFENIINSFSDEIAMPSNLTTKLSLIELEYYDTDTLPFKGIKSTTWQNIRRLCPDLKLNIRIILIDENNNDLTFYLPKNIPLVLLEFGASRDDINDDEELPLSDLLISLKNCFATLRLRHLKIEWRPALEDTSTDFVTFFQACQKLNTLEMFLRLPCLGLKELFESWLQNRPVSLESVHLSIKRVLDEEDKVFLMSLADEYCPLLQAAGLRVTLLIDSLDENN